MNVESALLQSCESREHPLYIILCFVSCSGVATSLNNLALVSKRWKEIVMRRVAHLYPKNPAGNVPLLMAMFRRYRVIDQILCEVASPSCLANGELDTEQQQLKNLYQDKYLQICEELEGDFCFYDACCLGTLQLAQLKAELFWERHERRKTYYRQLCHYLQLPPDKNILDPLPPARWDQSLTYILVQLDRKNNNCIVMQRGADRMRVFNIQEFDDAYTPTCNHRYYASTHGKYSASSRLYPSTKTFRSSSTIWDSLNCMENALSDGMLSNPPDCALVAYVFLLKRKDATCIRSEGSDAAQHHHHRVR